MVTTWLIKFSSTKSYHVTYLGALRLHDRFSSGPTSTWAFANSSPKKVQLLSEFDFVLRFSSLINLSYNGKSTYSLIRHRPFPVIELSRARSEKRRKSRVRKSWKEIFGVNPPGVSTVAAPKPRDTTYQNLPERLPGKMCYFLCCQITWPYIPQFIYTGLHSTINHYIRWMVSWPHLGSTVPFNPNALHMVRWVFFLEENRKDRHVAPNGNYAIYDFAILHLNCLNSLHFVVIKILKLKQRIPHYIKIPV